MNEHEPDEWRGIPAESEWDRAQVEFASGETERLTWQDKMRKLDEIRSEIGSQLEEMQSAGIEDVGAVESGAEENSGGGYEEFHQCEIR